LVKTGGTPNDKKRQKQKLYSNQDTKTTINSIQNFYENFCQPSPESLALDITDTDPQQMAEKENETIDTNEEEISTTSTRN
jgi:hypothetical protein